MKFEQKWIAYENGIRENAFHANVPGCVQKDYAEAHGFENYQYADNVHQFDAIEDYAWTYECDLSYTLAEGEKLFFVSRGIDYAYEIYLNDDLLYSHEGMFSPVEVDLTEKLAEENRLRVVIAPHPKRADAPAGTRDEADRSTKPAVSYGWDFHPRLIVSGIWDETYLETRAADYIYRCEAFYTLNDTLTKAEVEFDIDCGTTPEIEVFNPDGSLLYRGYDTKLTVETPKLWWCNGQGEPNLYTYQVKTGTCEKEGHIGFRKIELVPNEGCWEFPKCYPKTRSTPPFTIRLNDRVVFAKGTNLVNLDIFNGAVTEERYAQMLSLVKNANMNIVRCWGGAAVNKEAFFDLCDAYGIMVWQEFPLACNNYYGEHYLETLGKEATAVIKRVRKHPAHVLWCGGNELFCSWSRMTEQSEALRLLNKLCYELDRKKPFIMSSPVMGVAHGPYQFYDYGTGTDSLTAFYKSKSIAYPEFGVPSIAEKSILEEIIPPDEIGTLQLTGSWEIHHAYWAQLDIMEAVLGEVKELSEQIRFSNLFQAVGYQAIFEEARRQKPLCSMALNWCFNEPWTTAANNSVVSYPARKKPAYYAIQAALRPVVASARNFKFGYQPGEVFRAELWLLNDSTCEVSDTIRAYLEFDGEEIFVMEWKTGTVAANCNRCGNMIQYILPDTEKTFFKLKLKSENGYDSEYTLYIEKKKVKVVRMINDN